MGIFSNHSNKIHIVLVKAIMTHEQKLHYNLIDFIMFFAIETKRNNEKKLLIAPNNEVYSNYFIE